MTEEDFQALYKKTLGTLRRYSVAALCAPVLNLMPPPDASGADLASPAPWLLLLLVKWALADEQTPLRGATEIAESAVELLREDLWNIGPLQEEQGFIGVNMLRSVAGVQLQMQMGPTSGFIRWAALVNRLERNSKVRQGFASVVGIEPEIYIDLTSALLAASRVRQVIPVQYFSALTAQYGDNVGKCLNLFSGTLEAMRAELIAAKFVAKKSDLVDQSFFIRYPFLRMGDSLVCWHAGIAAIGLSEGAHIRLSALNEQYAQPFGRIFENYVLELLREANLSFVGHDEFEERALSQSKIAEAVINLGAKNLIVEAKMGLFGDAVISEEGSRALKSKLKPLRNAIAQGLDVSRKMRDGTVPLGATSAAHEDYLFIVTSRDLLISGGPMLKAMLAGEDDFSDLFAAPTCLPLQNIFIMGIESFERVCMAVKAGTNLSALLAGAAQRNRTAFDGEMHFDRHLPQGSLKGIPLMLEAAMYQASIRLEQSFKTAGLPGSFVMSRTRTAR